LKKFSAFASRRRRLAPLKPVERTQRAAPLASRDDLFRDIAIGINNSGLARLEQPLEQLSSLAAR